MSDYSNPPAKRPRTSRSDLLREPREELVERCLKLQASIDSTTQKQHNDDFLQLKEMNEKLRSQLTESAQRESILVMRLAGKEQEAQDLLAQLQELKESRCPGSVQLQSLLLDPSVNLLFENFKKELDACKTQLKQAQDDLSAFKFTPDSHIGKRLMAKCRLLLNENEELGRTISSGSVAKLESTIALEKKFIQEMKKTEKDNEYFLYDMNDEMEGLQATVYQLQQDLKEAREQLHKAQEENNWLRTTLPSGANAPSEGSVGSQTVSEASMPEAKRTDLSGEDASRLKRSAVSSTNSKTKSRRTDRKDASTERDKLRASSQTSSTGLHGYHERTVSAATKSGDKASQVQQTHPSDCKLSSTAGSAARATLPEESSNGSHIGEKVDSIPAETCDNSTQKSRLVREKQKQRTGVSSSKLETATSELANGLVSKHSASQKA